MKTTVVPAQITTVEDRVAGNLSFPQIILLVFALIVGVSIYGIMPPKVHLSSLKLILIILEFAFFGILALRFNGKIVGDWLIIYLRFKARPRRYLYTKNDLIHREIIQQEIKEAALSKKQETAMISKQSKTLTLNEQIKMDRIFGNEGLSVSFKMSKKGGVNVSLKQVES